jgi:signal transduction histidine kinase
MLRALLRFQRTFLPPIRSTLVFVLFWLILVVAQASEKGPIPIGTAYWKDTTGQATLAQAQGQDYTPYTGNFSGGYTDAVHWLRLNLPASEIPTALRLTPTWVDEITLYDSASQATVYRAGDRHPEGTNAQHVLGYAFVVPAASAPRDLWIRLRSTSSHQLLIKAMPSDQLAAANTRAIVWTALYAAILILMLMALLIAWLVQPEPVLRAYLVRHTNYILYGVSYLGLTDLLLYDLIPPGLLDQGFSLFVVLTLPLGLWFDITLLKTYNPNPRLLTAIKVLAWASLGLVALLLTGHARLALQLTVQNLLLATLLVFATAWSTKPEPLVERLVPKRIMLAYYVLILSSLLIGLTGLLGWPVLQGLTPYLLTLHGLVSGLLMTITLIVRGQRQRQLNLQMGWQLEKAQQTVEMEQRRRDEQSQFLHMLMHELKTPLSVVSLALGTRGNREENLQHASRAVLDMKAIIDRCIEADQLGQLTLKRHQNIVDAPLLIQSLADAIPKLSRRLQLHQAGGLPTLQTDRQLLQIVLANLLDNANQYSDPVTAITATVTLVEREGRMGLQMCVSNTPGLAGWPDAGQLFRKYYRSNGAKTDSGSGLGLFLSHQLAQTLGGTLDYSPSLQRVQFALWIPLSPA